MVGRRRLRVTSLPKLADLTVGVQQQSGGRTCGLCLPDLLQGPPGLLDLYSQLDPADVAVRAVDQDAPTRLFPLKRPEDQAKRCQQSPLIPAGPLSLVEQHRGVVEVPQA